jgi:membrane protease YdiL (CAAX protease family)
MVLNEILRAVTQIAALAAIPFLWWFVTGRKKAGFFHWIGLCKGKITEKQNFAILLVAAVIVAGSMSLVLDLLLPKDIQLANERFNGLGFNALIPAIIFSVFATALPEEILFRGFLGKRLSDKLGFAAGNFIQAILFGLLHGAMLFASFGIEIPLIVIAFTGTLGFLMGCINEKADGSILPSIFVHSASNIYASVIVMFNLFQ